jgi:4-carboxymuconolactone decarboxylase
VYCGWPKGSFLDQVVWSQHVRIAEERELVLHFAAYAGWPKGSFLDQVVAESWAQITAEEQESQKS